MNALRVRLRGARPTFPWTPNRCRACRRGGRLGRAPWCRKSGASSGNILPAPVHLSSLLVLVLHGGSRRTQGRTKQVGKSRLRVVEERLERVRLPMLAGHFSVASGDCVARESRHTSCTGTNVLIEQAAVQQQSAYNKSLQQYNNLIVEYNNFSVEVARTRKIHDSRVIGPRKSFTLK